MAAAVAQAITYPNSFIFTKRTFDFGSLFHLVTNMRRMKRQTRIFNLIFQSDVLVCRCVVASLASGSV